METIRYKMRGLPRKTRTFMVAGEQFAYLTAIERAPKRGKNQYWRCKCVCGNEITVQAGSLRNGNTKSCGCKTGHHKLITHGIAGTPIYMIWAGMLQRCENPKTSSYKWYGARGIKVCDEWHDFAKFYADMGPRPSDLTIERQDSNGDYCKANCVWISRSAQSSNTRRTIKVTYQGRTMPLAHWAKEIGVSDQCLYYRHQKGWPLDRLFAKPFEP